MWSGGWTLVELFFRIEKKEEEEGFITPFF
jgi:hypothetical protein